MHEKAIRIPSSKKEWFGFFAIALVLLPYCLLLARKGFDITDTGYNLTRHYLYSIGDQLEGPLWLSDWIGGKWLSLTHSLGWFGASLGWCLLVLFFAFLSYVFILPFLGSLFGSMVAILTGLILIGGRLEVLYYTNLGAFLLTMGAFAFLSFCQRPKLKKLFLFGALAGLTFGCRFPSTIAFFLFPIFILITNLLFSVRITKETLRNIFLSEISCVLGVLVFLLLTWARDGWESYIYGLKLTLGQVQSVPTQEEHEIKFLWDIYWHHFTWRLLQAFVYSISVVFTFLAIRFISSNSKRVIAGGFSLIVLTGCVWWGSDEVFNNFRAALGTFSILITALLLIVLFFTQFYLKKMNQTLSSLFLYQLVLLSTALFTFAGSSAGFLNMHLGQWVLLPFQLLLLAAIFSNGKKFDFANSRGWVGGLAILVLAPLAIKSVALVSESPYRDYGQMNQLSAETSLEKLSFIETSPSRAHSVESFLEEAQKRLAKGDTVFAYNSIPAFYYLTETKPYLENSWPTIQGKKAMDYYLKQKKSEDLPRFLFRAITNTQSLQWGNGRIVPPHSRVSNEAVVLVDQWAKSRGYKLVWSNQDFLILEKPKK